MWGGSELHTLATARALAEHGRIPVILQLGHSLYSAPERGVTDPGILVVQLPAPGSGLLSWAELLRRHAIDIVVLVKGAFASRWMSLDLSMLLSSRRYVCIEHSLPPLPEPRRSGRHLGGLVPGLGLWHLRQRAGMALHRLAPDRVIVVSHAIKQRMVDHLHYDASNIAVVQNGIDSSRFVADATAAAAARRRWDIPSGAFVVGTVARLVKQKRLDRLVAAFQQFHAQAPDAFLVLVGAGPEEAALRAQAAELGISGRCRWPGESGVPNREYPGFDCFAMTSEVEGLPYTLLEAMASERMVVAMVAPGVSEVLAAAGEGLLLKQDVGSFARAIAEVRAMAPERRAESGMRARRFVQMHHVARRQVEAVCSEILPVIL